MTSPLEALAAQRTIYIDVTLSDAIQKFDEISAFRGENLKLVFRVKNANDAYVDLTGADVSLHFSKKGTRQSVLAITDDIDIDGEYATAEFSTADLSEDYQSFYAQLKIVDAGNTVIGAHGFLALGEMIE